MMIIVEEWVPWLWIIDSDKESVSLCACVAWASVKWGKTRQLPIEETGLPSTAACFMELLPMNIGSFLLFIYLFLFFFFK